jgi:hypothetical protein
MTSPAKGAARLGRAGFTLIEVLIYLTLSVAVLGAIYSVMIGQGRAYGKQRELLDVRESLRSAGALLAWELRHAATSGSVLLVAKADSVRLHSVQGLGVVCAKHATLPRYALWRTSGDFAATVDDSVMVYKSSTSTWQKLRLSQVGTPASLGVSACSWASGGKTPDLAVELSGITAPADTAGIIVGSALRSFRQMRYAEYQEGGRWWLGRQVDQLAFEKLTGPLLAPADSGLKFRYLDAAGAVTTTPSSVASVEITLKAQSYKQYYKSRGTVEYQADAIRTRVVLR